MVKRAYIVAWGVLFSCSALAERHDIHAEADRPGMGTGGCDVGVDWVDWAPTPDVFASLAFNFMPTEKFGLFVESYNIFDP